MWEIIFWLSIAMIIYPYFGYPVLLYFFGRFKSRTSPAATDSNVPSMCLLISAFNEEKIIRKKIENSLGLDYPRDKLRILIASDGSTDDTVAIAGEYTDRGVELFHREQRSGKSAVINEAINITNEQIVVFTDANCMYAQDALLKLSRHFSCPEIGCVVGKLSYVERHMTSVGKGEGVYWKYEEKIKILESRLQSVLVGNGAILAIRRELFSHLYPEVANDFQLPVEIGSRGYGILYDPEAVTVERSTIFWQEEFQRKVRIVLRGLTGFSILKSRFRGFRLWQFISHKMIRWLIAPFLVLAIVANALLLGGSWLYNLIFAGQIVFYLAAGNGWRLIRTRKPRSIFYVPFYFTMVNFAAIVAIVKFLSGSRQTVWEKAESARFSPAPATGNSSSLPANSQNSKVAPEKEKSATR